MKDKLKGKSVLVTGGAGFIGTELVRQLLNAGASVTVVDNFANGLVENLPNVTLTDIPKSLEERLEMQIADIRDSGLMEELMVGTDIVYHLACMGVRHSIHSPRENHEVNAEGTLNLLCFARQAGVGRFVYVSSSEVYGTARTVPMTEEHPTFPMTVYGAGKLAGDSYARAFWHTYGYPTVVVRPFNAYGPRSHHEGDSGEVIPKFMLRGMAGKPMVVFGDGTQTRDFTYVSDTAWGILLAGVSEAAVGETINLGSGFEVTVSELAREIAGVLGQAQPSVVNEAPRPGDVLRLYSDSTKAKELLGFTPSVSLREGLTLLRDWYASLDCSPEELLRREVVRNWESDGDRVNA